MAAPRHSNVEKLLQKIEESQIGYNSTLQGPFGTKKVVYTDYTASGKSLSFIEEYIRDKVLPHYGNTHTTTTITSRQTTFFREEARLIIRNAVNASEQDCVVFAGSGCTGAVHKLIHCLNLTSLSQPPVVFVSPFEHHSNLLPWKEIGAEVVWIAQDWNGQVDISDLEQKLKHYSCSGRKLIGALSAASNITGVLTDTNSFSAMLHRYSALAFWDYATAAPYVKIDMNPVVVTEDKDMVYKDAIYFSMHKFVGGVDSPGVLVAKKELFENSTPHSCGGGTVFFVTPTSHRYFKEAEMREEGGTPAIVGSIRAGLAMQLKEAVGTCQIMTREKELCQHVFSEWASVQELVVVGPHSIPRLPVFSLLVRHPHSGRFLHPNFVCSLLNDLFGVQARGGCSCAGPYAQSVLGISEELAKKYEAVVMEDSRLDRIHLRRYHEYSEREVLRPGVTRLSFPYFMSRASMDYVIKAVAMVAKHGWKLLPQYLFNPETGMFRHHRHHFSRDRCWLSSISYDSGEMVYTRSAENSPPSFEEMLLAAEKVFEQASQFKADPKSLGDQSLFLSEEAELLRWFLLPSEAQCYLLGQPLPAVIPPFQPRIYPSRQLDCTQPTNTVYPDRSREAVERDDTVSLSLNSSFAASGNELQATSVKEHTNASLEVQLQIGACGESHEQEENSTCSNKESSSHSSSHGIGTCTKLSTSVTKRQNGSEVVSGANSKTVNERAAYSHCVSPVDEVHSREGDRHPCRCSSEAVKESREEDVEDCHMETKVDGKPKFHCPPKRIMKPTIEAIEEYSMICPGDHVLVCLSGGKDSLSLLHTLHQYQFIAKAKGVEFDLGAVTVDPMSSSYNPRPLIGYLAALGVPYFYEEQGILQQAVSLPECASICSFCSRMKRGRLYTCARREGYNVLAMGQHLDDLAESFLMSAFHNGFLRTMKANYTVQEGDLRVIRPFVYAREKDLRHFADKVHLPVIPENCPACFEAPKERHRVKQLLATQELLFPTLFQSLMSAMKPLMARDRTGMEARQKGQERSTAVEAAAI